MDKLDVSPLPPATALLAIDPGLNGTGWAFWGPRTLSKKYVPPPTTVGVMRKRHDTFVATANWLADELLFDVVRGNRKDVCSVHLSRACGCSPAPPLVVTCEFPEYQTGASRSMGWMRGDLQKLTYLVGVLGRMTYAAGAVFEPVPVSQWKGQLPKDVVTDRIINKLGNAACERLGIKTHAWDATGIGLWRLGEFQ